MSLPASLHGLLSPAAYPHRCGAIELVETHISWVILTGELVYKLKKPVEFSFVDFSTLERRRHFCDEELRCNRRFAPALYVDVVAITREGDDGVVVGGDGEVVEWAVKMRQFDGSGQLDRLLERGAVEPDMLERFGATLAGQHGALPADTFADAELEPRVLGPMRDNFRDLEAVPWLAPHGGWLAQARRATERQARRHRHLMLERLADGTMRECHGDLHLSNLVLLDDGVCAFDCLEFDPRLRWIDPMSDVAFLFMDCLVRGRADLGYAFLDGYLSAGGDYPGVPLLPLYAAYRSMVRAKVAALRRGQAEAAQAPQLEARTLSHGRWAAGWLARPPGRLVLMCGLSGSGKSFLARRLAPRLPAVRLRSDVARKAQAGLSPFRSASAAVGAGLYSPDRTEAVYRSLGDVAAELLQSGEHVIVDATFLDAARRGLFLDRARRVGAGGVVVHCDAPLALLEERVMHRARDGGDASDADLEVLAAQRARFEVPEDALQVNTGEPLDQARLEHLAAAITRG